MANPGTGDKCVKATAAMRALVSLAHLCLPPWKGKADTVGRLLLGGGGCLGVLFALAHERPAVFLAMEILGVGLG